MSFNPHMINGEWYAAVDSREMLPSQCPYPRGEVYECPVVVKPLDGGLTYVLTEGVGWDWDSARWIWYGGDVEDQAQGEPFEDGTVVVWGARAIAYA